MVVEKLVKKGVKGVFGVKKGCEKRLKTVCKKGVENQCEKRA